MNFVSSTFSSDRLQHIQIGQTLYISNSLVCLCAALNLHVDPWYPWYYEDITSIVDSPEEYKTAISTNRGDVYLSYYRNLLWDGKQLIFKEKAATPCAFSDFSSYRHFLTSTLKKLANNLQSTARPFPLEPISTSSAGFDSLCVSILSKTMGTKQVICVTKDRIGRDDSAVDLIRQLDMEPLSFERSSWRNQPFAETSFLAGDACGRDVWLYPAKAVLRRKLLLTGYFGGRAWGVPAQPGHHNFSMPSPPGLSMTEFRLKTGFLHCPVPSLGAEHIDIIRNIGASHEMQPWCLGEKYDRPVPRRIIEDAGLLRGKFGFYKTATNVHLFRRKEFDQFLAGTQSFRDYMLWIRKQSQFNPPPTDKYPLTVPSRELIEVPLFRQLFPWALERSKKNYIKEIST